MESNFRLPARQTRKHRATGLPVSSDEREFRYLRVRPANE